MKRKWLHALGFLVERMDIPLLGLAGTNLLGLALAFAVFLPLGILLRQFGSRIEGVLNFLGGVLVFTVDWIYRRNRRKFDILSESSQDIVLESDQGGRLLYIPSWIWGVIWMISGITTAIVELTKG